MIKEVFISKCKCEVCDSTVNVIDIYCRFCGNKLDDNIEYKELPSKQTRTSTNRKNL